MARIDLLPSSAADGHAEVAPALLELTDHAMIVWELDGDGIVFWNRAAAELYGYSPQEARGRVTHELLKTSVPSSSVRELETILSRRSIWVGQLRHTRRDGREITVESRIALLSHRNGKWLVLETNRAITPDPESHEVLGARDDARPEGDAATLDAGATVAVASAAARLADLLKRPAPEPAARTISTLARLRLFAAHCWRLAATRWEAIRPSVLWHTLAVLCFSAAPVLKWDRPWWELPPGELRVFATFLVGYLVSAAAAHVLVRTPGLKAGVRAATITLAVFGLVLAALLLAREPVSRFHLLAVMSGSLALVPSFLVFQSRRRQLTIGLAAITVVCVSIACFKAAASSQPPKVVAESLIQSAFYSLRAVTHAGVVPAPATRGGGLTELGQHVLLGTGDGRLYVLKISPGTDELSIDELPTRVPANREEFAAAFGGSSQSPRRSSEYSTAGPPRVQTWRFRVADVMARHGEDGRLQIFASHHFWKSDAQCFVVRVSALDAEMRDFPSSIGNATWRTLYESTPCVPLTGEYRNRGKNPFKGEEIGGRLALLNDRTLLLTLGDHDFSGLTSRQTFAQDPDASYGKTIRIDAETGASEIFTSGHRNPQGLHVSKDGRIWLTEHGPQGGDELNVLSPSANYGWPFVTYGADYGSMAWPLNAQQSRHANYTAPLHAWVPSIGVSNLITLQHGKFAIWNGDLLAGSLATQSLYRIVVENDRVVLDEAIRIGKRIRDLIELPDGRIMLWTDDASIVTLEPASSANGAMLFATLCSGCHQVADGLTHRLGPDLYALFDRPIASAPGYDEYSPGLKALNGRWTPTRLDAFLRAPQRVAPGTTMSIDGIADAEQRAAIIEHLSAAQARE